MPPAAVWRDALLAVLVVSALPLLAVGALAAQGRVVRRAAPQLACFAAGALVGAAVFQLIPEAWEAAPDARAVGVPVLLGAALFLVLERVLHASHATPAEHHAAAAPGRRTLVPLILIGDGLHNLLDGMLIAATFLADPAVGVFTTAAVALHEVPRELGTFGVFVHGGVSPARAVRYNGLTAAVSAVGAVAVLAVGPRAAGLAHGVLPFAAGNFLYIAGSLLVPLLRRAGSRRLLAVRAGLVALGLAATGAPALFR